jgi:FHS family glucose/mannose:H+ symporter-like MFS transporter
MNISLAGNGNRSTKNPDWIIAGLLSLIFALTGIGVVLPGTLLPVLSMRWHMGDGRAGMLFLFFSLGSSFGAVAARGKLALTLGGGCLLTGVGVAMMAWIWTSAPLFVMAIYGCGLGLSMTTVSLLRMRCKPGSRVAEMARLNLLWAAGACAGPSILLRANASYGITAVLWTVAIVSCILACAVLALVPSVEASPQTREGQGWLAELRAVPHWLLGLIVLATGIESGVGGWLSSYTARAGDLLGVTIGATTAFWAGLMFSRLCYAGRRDAVPVRRVILLLHPCLIVAGLILLIGSSQGAMSVCAALLIGAGVGPLYPLALALLLDFGEAGNVGFLMGGLGASLLPMMTGLVSAWLHTLRAGLGVLLTAGVLACVLGIAKSNQPNFRTKNNLLFIRKFGYFRR